MSFPVWLLPPAGFVVAISLLPLAVGDGIRGRGKKAQLAATLAFALLAVALAGYFYLARPDGVPPPQGLAGAVLAGTLLVAVPAAVYLQLGYRARLLWLAAAIWFASLLPLLFYLLVVALWISTSFECAPGEDCNPFS